MRYTLVSWGSLGLSVAFVLSLSCKPKPQAADMGVDMGVAQAAQAVEWVGYHTEVPFAAADFHALAAGLFGVDAQAGKLVQNRVIVPGVYVSGEAETAASDQTRMRFFFDDGSSQRTLALAPASYAIGGLFLAAVDVATQTMQGQTPNEAETFYLEYRVSSSQGGTLSLGFKGDHGKFSLVLDIASPRTSLDMAHIGQAAAQPGSTDSVAGTVWFHMSKDEFDYFADHAYGKGATGRQNFTDFHLVPFEWLRLSVEPHLDQQFVSVGFEVVGTDGKRVALAKAPASILAGATFQAMVDRSITTAAAQEAQKAGSSAPWQVPFYYDSPQVGGVVQVIAQGVPGQQTAVAYSVESPKHPLTDVPFLAYEPVTLPPTDPNAMASCEKLGDPTIVLAPKGTLNVSFTASNVVKTSPDLKGPLKGTIYCSVYQAADVTVSGPRKDATSLQDFQVPNADLGAATPPTFVTNEFYAGDYQILCAQDLDGNGDASFGDPVTLPIGAYTIACNKNPVTVEFAILDPQQ
jgi:hypothetical protein